MYLSLLYIFLSPEGHLFSNTWRVGLDLKSYKYQFIFHRLTGVVLYCDCLRYQKRITFLSLLYTTMMYQLNFMYARG